MKKYEVFQGEWLECNYAHYKNTSNPKRVVEVEPIITKPGNPRRGQKNKVIGPKVSPEAHAAYTAYTGNKSKMVSEAIVKYLQNYN